MLPFFTFYGGKNRAAKHYPAPTHYRIIEPFAGSAGYALNYPDRDVLLRDVDPVVTGTWDYLIHASEREILNLPDLDEGQTVNDLALPQEARWLIGWWLNKGAAAPRLSPSTFMRSYPQGGPYWGPKIRHRIAGNLRHIRHWQIECDSYESSPDTTATWFVDPPYESTGTRYRLGSRGIDYPKLADFCQTRTGQVIVCEADAAAWLPFQPLIEMQGTKGRQKSSPARVELIWTGGA